MIAKMSAETDIDTLIWKTSQRLKLIGLDNGNLYDGPTQIMIGKFLKHQTDTDSSSKHPKARHVRSMRLKQISLDNCSTCMTD